MLNPLSAMDHGSTTREILIYANLANYILTSIQPMLSYTILNKLTIGKNQRVPQNLDNPKNGCTFKQGWALGNLP